jgi:putative hydrolase of the HAD superfamily
MTATTLAPAQPDPGLEAVILDYNGVVGLQPDRDQWISLAALAGWPADDLKAFMTAFWRYREDYDAGAISTHVFWSRLLRNGSAAPPGSALLAALRSQDISMWTATDPAVLEVLRSVRAGSGVTMVLLSNAPAPLGDALDREEWCATLMSKALYSARLGCNKPNERAYTAAMAAAGWPDPSRTLFVDNLEPNCTAAARLGLRTLHFRGDATELARHLPQPVQGGNPPSMPSGARTTPSR